MKNRPDASRVGAVYFFRDELADIRIFLVALRPIRRAEEIRFDYSTTMLERHETMDCRCGASSCRKVVGDFDELPLALQREYRNRGIVQGYICQAIPL